MFILLQREKEGEKMLLTPQRARCVSGASEPAGAGILRMTFSGAALGAGTEAQPRGSRTPNRRMIEESSRGSEWSGAAGRRD